MWFDSWSGLVRILLVGTAAYVWLVLVLRVSGKRTLAKLNGDGAHLTGQRHPSAGATWSSSDSSRWAL